MLPGHLLEAVQRGVEEDQLDTIDRACMTWLIDMAEDFGRNGEVAEKLLRLCADLLEIN